MKIINETSLSSFDFWEGGQDFAEKLTQPNPSANVSISGRMAPLHKGSHAAERHRRDGACSIRRRSRSGTRLDWFEIVGICNISPGLFHLSCTECC